MPNDSEGTDMRVLMMVCIAASMAAMHLSAHAEEPPVVFGIPSPKTSPHPTTSSETANSTRQQATEADIKGQRILRRGAEVAVGTGLIIFDVVNTPVSPTPDAGLIGAGMITGRAAKTAANLSRAERTADAAIDTANVSRASRSRNFVQPPSAQKIDTSSRSTRDRVTKQARLRELADDPKVPRSQRGWIKQEENHIARGDRNTIRVPPGTNLMHQRGREAAKGFDHRHSQLSPAQLHRDKHKIDNYGRKNSIYPERPAGTPPARVPRGPSIPNNKNRNQPRGG
jgi:hypothetical protein